MFGINVSVRADRNILNNIAKGIDARTDFVTKEAAQMIVDYIDENWSAISPSEPGNPPAVVTGDLRQSYKITNKSSGKISAYEIIYASDHAVHLEFGTYKMAARPFLEPASVAVLPEIENKMKVEFFDNGPI